MNMNEYHHQLIPLPINLKVTFKVTSYQLHLLINQGLWLSF